MEVALERLEDVKQVFGLTLKDRGQENYLMRAANSHWAKTRHGGTMG